MRRSQSFIPLRTTGADILLRQPHRVSVPRVGKRVASLPDWSLLGKMLRGCVEAFSWLQESQETTSDTLARVKQLRRRGKRTPRERLDMRYFDRTGSSLGTNPRRNRAIRITQASDFTLTGSELGSCSHVHLMSSSETTRRKVIPSRASRPSAAGRRSWSDVGTNFMSTYSLLLLSERHFHATISSSKQHTTLRHYLESHACLSGHVKNQFLFSQLRGQSSGNALCETESPVFRFRCRTSYIRTSMLLSSKPPSSRACRTRKSVQQLFRES